MPRSMGTHMERLITRTTITLIMITLIMTTLITITLLTITRITITPGSPISPKRCVAPFTKWGTITTCVLRTCTSWPMR